jgi:hypothetical protein
MIDKIHDIRAKKEYEAIKGFYIHFLIYVCVNLLLVAINVISGGAMWAQWPLLGWGIGILAHGYSAFVKTPQQLAVWEAEQLALHASGKA